MLLKSRVLAIALLSLSFIQSSSSTGTSASSADATTYTVAVGAPPIFRLPINNTEPVFFYCSAPGACFDGMVGVINPNATWTFPAQFNYSQNATKAFSLLEYFP
ncbi:hypothetical protein G7Y89_g8518 [Cudoniella acicularis]|uniref:Uncharacterized protein n=1 Tax=Cudoniella acicularis TaxID=354080 RepID=A0A8H4RGE9_9HELO|nr:hypothetical protein G7Y89_g8518 [Cudoniella acicularis]